MAPLVQPGFTVVRETTPLKVSVIVSVALAAVLLVLLATASGNTDLFESHYQPLLWVTIGVAGMLLGLWLRPRMSPKWFYRVAYTLLFATGAKLLFDGARGLSGA